LFFGMEVLKFVFMERNKWFLVICVCFAAFFSSCKSGTKTDDLNTKVHSWLYASLDSLEEKTSQLLLLANHATSNQADVQNAFLACRNAYKNLEWFSEYYAPSTSRGLNGPPLPEIEIEENKISDAAGLQVIEEIIYPYDIAHKKDLLIAVENFMSNQIPLLHTIENTSFDTAHIFDACKLEIFRIVASGVPGFDTPAAATGINEAAVSLRAVKQILQMLEVPENVVAKIDAAINVARNCADQVHFDRLNFITDKLNPITTAMVEWSLQKHLPVVKDELALKTNARTLFDSAIFNSGFFVNSAEAKPTPAKVLLGEELFNNNKLAGNGRRSCRSCHQPEKAFTDGLATSSHLSGNGFALRNTPTLMYAGLQQAQFYDMRSSTLENQAMDVLGNKDEMHSSVETVTAWLNEMPEMKSRFKQAFSTMETEIKPRYVMMVLAGYIRSLQPFNSRFDAYMRGDKNALSNDEINGFNLFAGKAKCATCHFMPLFNGTAAPSFSTSESEVLGVLETPGIAKLDKDAGRYTHTQIAALKYAFKTPTLRNVAITAPYMHNGRYKTLEQVMEFYNKGGALGYGIDLQNQTLSGDSLKLSAGEIQSVIAFMKTLTDR